MTLPWLDPDQIAFPPADAAMEDPNGLLAAGGALNADWLQAAYRRGIFPWYEQGQPILWWSPDPRLVLFPEQLHVSRSLRKLIRKSPYVLTMDKDFPAVMAACAEPRRDSDGTWITPEMEQAYTQLHHRGLAHSVEAWQEDELVGGLYGVALGRVFFGESMFSRRDNASKLAFVALVEQLKAWGFELIDCQVDSEHLRSLGAEEISRQQFLSLLDTQTALATKPGPWQFEQR
ncbi:MAG: leucyl/phenylalanyl-tRNA--protein transferase [Pseudomonadales bacterium]|nr:leucyl/phenylalanyl-tRNA--protein transferase [Pseudomonadales bacterium]